MTGQKPISVDFFEIEILYQVPDPVALFPLNGAYGTKEIKGRVSQGVPRGVKLAMGPLEQIDSSYEFSGTSSSYIEFVKSAGGALDVRYSMTVLCWLYYNNQDGPLFNYGDSANKGVQFWAASGKLFARFTRRDYSFTNILTHTSLKKEWGFVGASYDRTSGDANLWFNGAAVHTLNIGANLELATQDTVRMGVMPGDGRYFKGRIAQMQIYSVALTQEDIQAIRKQVDGICFFFVFYLELIILNNSSG